MPGCSKCGSALKPGAAFCGGCGHPIEQRGSSPPPSQRPPGDPASESAPRGFILVGLISGALAALCQEWVAHNIMGVKTMAGMIRLLPFAVSLISSYRISRRSTKRSA